MTPRRWPQRPCSRRWNATPAIRSTGAEERGAKPVAAGGGIHIAFEGGRVGRLHAQHDKGGAVSFAQQAGAIDEFLLRPDRPRRLDPRSRGDLLEIDPEARMALLVPGLAVMPVIYAEDREVGR